MVKANRQDLLNFFNLF